MSEDGAREILRRLDDQDVRLARIESHVEKTNGRVTALELAKAWRDGASAAMGWVQPLLIALVSGIVVALVAALVAT